MALLMKPQMLCLAAAHLREAAWEEALTHFEVDYVEQPAELIKRLNRQKYDVIFCSWPGSVDERKPTILEELIDSECNQTSQLLIRQLSLQPHHIPPSELVDLGLFQLIREPHDLRQFAKSLPLELAADDLFDLGNFPFLATAKVCLEEVFDFYLGQPVKVGFPFLADPEDRPKLIKVVKPVTLEGHRAWAALSLDRRMIDFLGTQVLRQSLMSNDEPLSLDMSLTLCQQIISKIADRFPDFSDRNESAGFSVLAHHETEFLYPRECEIMRFEIHVGSRLATFDLAIADV
jgi:hypothetical protein